MCAQGLSKVQATFIIAGPLPAPAARSSASLPVAGTRNADIVAAEVAGGALCRCLVTPLPRVGTSRLHATVIRLMARLLLGTNTMDV